MQIKPFKVKNIQINSNVKLHIIDIEEITLELKDLIDKELIEIYIGDLDNNFKRVKKQLKTFFYGLDINKKMGATAEFLIHVYMRYIGFTQNCLFSNLEERSMKKGFDGYYSKGVEEWIMESKSGSILTKKKVTHLSKIKEAYNQSLKPLILGIETKNKKPNNPWANAYRHAKNTDTEKEILDNIRKLSQDYIDEKYADIETLNLVPSSTIFLDAKWIEYDSNSILLGIEELIKNDDFKFNQLEIICITKKSLQLFEDYLNE